MFLLIIVKAFNDVQRAVDGIPPEILSKGLRDLELNGFVTREVIPTTPATVLYELAAYSRSLDKVMEKSKNWRVQYRQRLVDSSRGAW